MMSWILTGLIVLSIICGLATGNLSKVSTAALEGSMNAVEMFITLLGALCLWSGLMKVAEEAGLTKIISRLLSPVTKRIFKGLDPKGKAMQAISMNMTANLLGLGNAATPLGLSAMRELDMLNGGSTRASDNMIKFVVLNTASIQLIPTTIAALRLKSGSQAPFEIMPAVWIVSTAALICTMTMVYLLKAVDSRHDKHQ